MGLKYTKRAMTSYEVHRFFHGLEISFFPDTLFYIILGMLVMIELAVMVAVDKVNNSSSY